MVVGVMGESIGADRGDDEDANEDENGRNTSRERVNFKRRQTCLCIVGTRQTLFSVYYDPASPTYGGGRGIHSGGPRQHGMASWLDVRVSGCQGARTHHGGG